MRMTTDGGGITKKKKVKVKVAMAGKKVRNIPFDSPAATGANASRWRDKHKGLKVS